ncbi:hypothetical protein AXG93_4698s1080 [Marchantia polymorpha subsp. ruderalis]|uniref:Uncharacterized protein n=1 Tax=Marchantia polymorpha subsp. ruderalis TaxID=1480154 RepID=A0A176VHM4_MARPO|nr:hypothetical protein AXG93_4698s1080 [Marchantia polymorpha subsp. ruderalis]
MTSSTAYTFAHESRQYSSTLKRVGYEGLFVALLKTRLQVKDQKKGRITRANVDGTDSSGVHGGYALLAEETWANNEAEDDIPLEKVPYCETSEYRS